MEEEDSFFLVQSFDNQIGYGKYADVYKVYDSDKGKTYACKIFRDDPSNNLKADESMENEFQIIKNVKHPLIIPVIYSGKLLQNYKEKFVMVTKFYENGTLYDLLKLDSDKKSKIGWNDTKKLNFIYLLAIAMSFLHKQKIVHRDLKPSNILIDEYLHPIVSDFGLSKIKDEAIINFTESRGTPFYMSPEIIREEDYTEKVDVYAFGIILYEIITDLSPYHNTNRIYQFLYAVALNKLRPKIPSTVPPLYKSLMEKCWNDDPNQRPSFDQIITQLENEAGFITPEVNLYDFNSCIQYASQFRSEYDPKKPIKKIDDFIHHETSNFKKVEINEQKAMSHEENLFLYKQALQNERKNDEQSLEEAVSLYKMAAQNNHCESMFKYGYMLLNGIGVEENKEEAIKFLKPAVDKGHAEAMFVYSHIITNVNQSNEYLEKSAEKGNPDALYEYALKVYNGEYFDCDRNKAELCFKKAADEGHVESMFNYARILDQKDFNENEMNQEIIQQNKRDAALYYKKAADLGHVESMKRLAFMLKNGDGISQDLMNANRYFELANPIQEKKEWYVLDSLDDFILKKSEKIKENPNIFKGEVNSTNQKVVCKVANNQNIPKLKNELNNMINCCHPLIQKVIGFYNNTDNSEATLITYFHENSSLDDHMNDFIIKYPESYSNDDDDFKDENNSLFFNHYKIIVGLCSSLKYLEEKGMFHGNLNPSNILLDKDKAPILNNILMKAYLEHDEINEKYNSPDEIKTIKSDVYSFALIVKDLFFQNEPNFLTPLLEKCLSNEIEQRPSFNEIFSTLSISFSSNKVITSFVDDIKSQMKSQITFFRAPKIIVHSQTDIKQDESNLNTSKFMNLRNFENILSRVSYNRNIKFIMLCGKFQSGKSTFLRTITGNGGFFMGENNLTTTMGILIDGPYSSQDIIDRIGSLKYKKDFTEKKVVFEDDPAIFFIDSQGVGDEHFNKFRPLKKYLSFFCTLSDLCINVCEMTEHYDVIREITNIIRAGQASTSISSSSDDKNVCSSINEKITKIIFLTKNYTGLPKEVNSRTQLMEIQTKFEDSWFNVHQDLKERYIKNLIKPLPIGNPRTSLTTYNYTVWNTIRYIAHFLNNTPKHTKDYVQNRIELALSFLFSDFFEPFNEQFDDIKKQIEFVANASLQLLSETIGKYKQNSITKEEALENIKSNFTIIKDLIVPFTIGQNKDSDMSFQDYNQYSYDLMKDITAYLQKSLPELSENLILNFKEFFFKDFIDVLGGGVAAGGTAIASAVLTNLGKQLIVQAVEKILPLLIPGGVVVSMINVVSSLISVGSFLYWFLNNYNDKNKRVSQIMMQQIELRIPFLWENCMNEQRSKSLIKILKSPKNVSGIYYNNIIIVLDKNKKINFMKFIIQSMTGVDTKFREKDENEKESILYGPFKPKELIQRTSRCFPEYESEIKNDIYILYLKGYKKADFQIIKKVQDNVLLFLSSVDSIDLDNLPENKEKPFFLFTECNKKVSLVVKNQFSGSFNNFPLNFFGNDYKVTDLPLIMENNFDKIGPLTNKCLRSAFNKILKRVKKNE